MSNSDGVAMKGCRECGETKPLTDFYAHPKMADGRLSACKPCRIEYGRLRHERNKGCPVAKQRKRNDHRRARLRGYGLTEGAYQQMLAKQGGVCAICGTSDPGHKSIYFPVDHDHQTGRVRGLLCNDCNLGLPRFHDDPNRMLAAAAYVLAQQDVLGSVVF